MDSLRFHPAARAELIEATVYLEEHRPGSGHEFANAVEELLKRIIQLPESGAPLSGYPPEFDVRAFRLRRFQYSLIVAVVDGRPMVEAVAHQRRRPGYWANRIR
jgi:plasmid stabilization system protein ParE